MIENGAGDRVGRVERANNLFLAKFGKISDSVQIYTNQEEMDSWKVEWTSGLFKIF